MDPVTGIFIMVLCLALEAFFSGSEIGIVSADRAKLLHQAEQGSQGARLALEMLKKPSWLLSTTLVGTNVAIVTNTTVATMLAVSMFGEKLGWVAAIVVAPLSWVFGEIVAKSVFQHYADSLTPKVIGFVKFSSYIFFPILVAFSFVTGLLARLSGKDESNLFTIREEISALMQMQSLKGDIDPEEQVMIRRVFEFHDTSVAEVLVPLIDVIGVEDTATCGEAAAIAAKHAHHRLTVYHERVDNIVGALDALELIGADSAAPIAPLIRPVRFVPGSQNVEELLLALRKSSKRMAVIVDEYGGVEGIVTVKDLLEEVVGEISDEQDEGEALQMIEKLGRNKLRVNARIDIQKLAKATPVQLPDGNYETLGGFLIDLAHDIPEEGSSVKYRKYTFDIEKVSDRAILQVIIKW
jgi:putative hemolysin